jgi:hypothetical protein
MRMGPWTIAAGALVILGVVVVATTGDSWAVRMTLSLVTIDVAVRLARWGQRQGS